jgi:hypothetical protein
MHSSQRSQTTTDPSRRLPESLMHEACLFLPENIEALGTVSKAFHQVTLSPRSWTLWKQLLQRDFGIPHTYCHAMIQDKKNPAIVLRAVHQRLTYLKKENPRVYSHYRYIIIESGVDFLPLSATGPSYPVVDAKKRAFYLYEAIRLRNIGLAAHLLLQLDNESLKQFVNPDTIEVAIEMTTKKQGELLRRLLPYAPTSVLREVMQWFLAEHKSSSSVEATNLFVKMVGACHFGIAIKLLQAGVAPNSNALESLFEHNLFMGARPREQELALELVSLVPQYPQLLRVSKKCLETSAGEDEWTCPGDFTTFIGNLWGSLHKKASFELAEAIYKVAKQIPSVYNKKRLAFMKSDLLDIAVISGNLSAIQSLQQSLDLEDKISLVCRAIEEGQLSILQHLVTQMDKKTFVSSERIRDRIERRCPHKNIVKYLVEQYKLLELDNYKDLKASWLKRAASEGHVDLVNYFIADAPTEYRLLPTEDMLSDAISRRKIAVMQSLIKKHHMKPTEDDFREARTQGGMMAVQLFDYFLDKALSDVSPKEFMKMLSQNIAVLSHLANWFSDTFTGPKAISRGFKLSADDVKAHIDSNFHCSTQAWLAAKFEMAIDQNILTASANSVFNAFKSRSNHYDGDEVAVQCRQAFADLYLVAFQAFCRQYRELHRNEVSSTAMVLSEIQKAKPEEQKQQVACQESSRLSLAAPAATSASVSTSSSLDVENPSKRMRLSSM